jgi:hypothetical protein
MAIMNLDVRPMRVRVVLLLGQVELADRESKSCHLGRDFGLSLTVLVAFDLRAAVEVAKVKIVPKRLIIANADDLEQVLDLADVLKVEPFGLLMGVDLIGLTDGKILICFGNLILSYNAAKSRKSLCSVTGVCMYVTVARRVWFECECRTRAPSWLSSPWLSRSRPLQLSMFILSSLLLLEAGGSAPLR